MADSRQLILPAGILLLVIAVTAAVVYPRLGLQSDGSYIIPTGQKLTPAGRHFEVNDRPLGMVLSPDGKRLAVVTGSNFAPRALHILDSNDGKLLDRVVLEDSFAGVAFSLDGHTLYVGGGTSNEVKVLREQAGGGFTKQDQFPFPAGAPSGLTLSADGATLYVALNLKHSVAIIDLPSRNVTEVPVGMYPYTTVAALGGKKVYVSNWGGRRGVAGDMPDERFRVVVDPRTGTPSSGTVSVIDADRKALSKDIEVGLHPSALALSPKGDRLFVTNANSDTVSVIDTTNDTVLYSIDVRPGDKAPIGSAPNALAVSADAKTLYVANGANNAIAVVDIGKPGKVRGLIPTGWYPTAVASAGNGKLWVASGYGFGSIAPQAQNRKGRSYRDRLGVVSLIDLPEGRKLRDATAQVMANNRLVASGETVAANHPVPIDRGHPSPIRHVFYIIKENRTYDQVLGDLPQGNGDPALVQFGRDVSPNHHALAESFVLLDNFYTPADQSALGHKWCTQGYASDWAFKEGADPHRSVIFIKDLRDPAVSPRQLLSDPWSGQGLAWSRDGKLAFLSNGGSPGQLQLYIADKPGIGTPRKLTSLKGYLADPRWSPDGRSIAMLWIEGVTRVPGPTEATVADTGVVASEIVLQRLALVNSTTGEVRAISPAGMYVYEFDWSPDSKGLAYLAAPGPGDDNWYIAELFSIDSSGGSPRRIAKPAMQVANVRWSPDGKNIAFIGGLMSDEGSTGGDIYTVSASGGALKNLTPKRNSSPNWFRWMPSSKQILMTEGTAGQMAISTLDLASGSSETLWKGADSIVFSGDTSNSAIIRNSWIKPPEVWAGRTGAWQQVSHANDNAHPMWGEAKSIEWTSDRFHVQGWLLYPQPYDPSKRYPMIVVVHGGPAAEVRPSWPRPGLPLQLLSAHGYFLFLPNPRGSYGQGEEFTRANVRDFGYGDLRDVLAGVDTVTKSYPVDEKRIGIAGWSYGGYMTMWTVTQTNRFRAAFAGAGIANWQSYYGENSIDQWMLPYFGASVYDDPAVYAKSSPINFIKNVKTPTLVVVGERDGECPPPQSYEFWHALKTFGVKTEFVIYPGEGHGFHDPEHTRDLFQRVLKWFQENMPAG